MGSTQIFHLIFHLDSKYYTSNMNLHKSADQSPQFHWEIGCQIDPEKFFVSVFEIKQHNKELMHACINHVAKKGIPC